MSFKTVQFRSQARESISRGTAVLADAVRITLGQKSHWGLVERKWGKLLVRNDGVTIAKEFELEDPSGNLGTQIIRLTAEKTGHAVGDGTRTLTLLAQPGNEPCSLRGLVHTGKSGYHVAIPCPPVSGRKDFPSYSATKRS